ncbi:MAG: hypothetical protein ABIJ96_18290 [Elusimicrobiota bacterium]
MKALTIVVLLSLPAMAATPTLEQAADVKQTLTEFRTSSFANPQRRMPAAYWVTGCKQVTLDGRQTLSQPVWLESSQYQEFCHGSECWTDRTRTERRKVRIKATQQTRKETFKVCLTATSLRAHAVRSKLRYRFDYPEQPGRPIVATPIGVRIHSAKTEERDSEMPDQPRDDADPIGTGDLDDLGNPRRDTTPGPDDVHGDPWDGGGRDSGGGYWDGGSAGPLF